MLALTTTPAQLVAALGGELCGDVQAGVARISRIAPIESAGKEDVTFLAHARYAKHLAQCQATCVILSPELLARAQEQCPGTAYILTDQPYLYYASLSQWWEKQTQSPEAGGIDPTAVVHPTARVHATAKVGALCYVGPHVEIGAHTVLRTRVTIEAHCFVGERCLIHSGVVIGADGFGFAPTAEKQWQKIAQLGAVRIGNDVEIGANSCIDRGALQDTLIEDGVKLDNLVQIGHNVRVGAHSALAGCAGVAGSATIGRRCTVGGGAVVLGHLELADDVHISASSTVMRSITQPGQYSGVFPLDSNSDWEKRAVLVRKLPDLRERVKQLEKQIAELSGGEGFHRLR